jgi:hypothetical protein
MMRIVITIVIAVLALDGRAAQAQSSGSPPLSEMLPDLILRGITLPPPTGPDLSHEAHFSPIDANELNNPAVGIVTNFNKSMIAQLSTFPLGSSSGGFTYTFDASIGTFRRASNSFGPAFAERATTIGRGRFNAGITYQHTPYRTFEGQRLDDGSIKFYLRHQECCSPGIGGGTGGGGGGGGGGSGPTTNPNGTRLSPPFEGDLIEAALSLKATTDTVAIFGNYGLADRWDVALVVPVVRVKLDATVRATIIRLSTPREPLTHTFEAGNPQADERTYSEGGTATGLGDVLVRTKYRFLSFTGGGLAAAVDVRLPTGDQEELLGAGTQVKGFLVASGGMGRFSPHLNIGYTFVDGEVGESGLLAELGGTAPVPDELNYAMGMEFAPHPKLTLIGDVVGRTLRRAGRLDMVSKGFQYQDGPSVLTATFDEFDPRAGSLNLLLGAVGAKFNPAGAWLLSANVLFPLTDAGLRSRVTTVVGLDFAF